MARLGRGQPVPPIIRRSSLVDSTPPGTDYPLRPTVVVCPNARDLARTRTWRAPLMSRGSPLAAGAPFTFPTTPLGVILEVAPGADPADDPDAWPWIEVTDRVMRRGSEVSITITRGATSETSNAP